MILPKTSVLSYSTNPHSCVLSQKLQNPSFLADFIIEAAAIADGSLELCRLTYVLEGDSPLIFVAFAALNGFEQKFRSIDSIDMPKLAAAAAEAADIIKETLDPYRCAMADASLKLECAKVSVEDFHQKNFSQKTLTSAT